MRIVRVRNPEGVDHVKKYFLDDPDINKEAAASQLKQLMEVDPEACCFLAAISEETISGFMITLAAPGARHAFVFQAWAGEGFPAPDRDKMFIRTCLWAESIGRDELRMETKRSELAFERRWGFKHYSAIMNFNIPENMDFSFLREPTDGRQLETKHRINTVRRTDEDISGDQGVSGREDRSSSGVVPGGASSTPNRSASVQLELFESGVEHSGSAGSGDDGDDSTASSGEAGV